MPISLVQNGAIGSPPKWPLNWLYPQKSTTPTWMPKSKTFALILNLSPSPHHPIVVSRQSHHISPLTISLPLFLPAPGQSLHCSQSCLHKTQFPVLKSFHSCLLRRGPWFGLARTLTQAPSLFPASAPGAGKLMERRHCSCSPLSSQNSTQS